jgi:hypothetical protein
MLRKAAFLAEIWSRRKTLLKKHVQKPVFLMKIHSFEK